MPCPISSCIPFLNDVISYHIIMSYHIISYRYHILYYYESQLCWDELPRLLNEVTYSNTGGIAFFGSLIQPQPAFRVALAARASHFSLAFVPSSQVYIYICFLSIR